MKKIKQLSFVLFIFSVLAFSYPVTQVFAQYADSEYDRQLQLLQEQLRSLQEQIQTLRRRVEDLETPLPPEATSRRKTGATGPPQSSPPQSQHRPPNGGLQDFLTNFFVSRLGGRIDRHTHVVLNAFNTCTGQSYSIENLRLMHTPSAPADSDDSNCSNFENCGVSSDTPSRLIAAQLRQMGLTRYQSLFFLNPNLLDCLCESNIDTRIKRGGLRCP